MAWPWSTAARRHRAGGAPGPAASERDLTFHRSIQPEDSMTHETSIEPTILSSVSTTRSRELLAPFHVRFHGVDVSEVFLERARDRLERQLGRFSRHVTRVMVRIEDENGSKGGVDMRCRIEVALPA